MRYGGSLRPLRGILFSRLRRSAGCLLHRQLPRLATAPRRTTSSTSSKTGPTSASKATSTRGTPGSGTRTSHRTTRSTPRRQTRRSGVDGLADHQPAPSSSSRSTVPPGRATRSWWSTTPFRPTSTRSRRRRATDGFDPAEAVIHLKPGRASIRCARRHPPPPSGKTKIPGDGYAGP